MFFILVFAVEQAGGQVRSNMCEACMRRARSFRTQLKFSRHVTWGKISFHESTDRVCRPPVRGGSPRWQSWVPLGRSLHSAAMSTRHAEATLFFLLY